MTIFANRKTRMAIYCHFSSQPVRLVLRGQAGTLIWLAAADLSKCGTRRESVINCSTKNDPRQCPRMKGENNPATGGTFSLSAIEGSKEMPGSGGEHRDPGCCSMGWQTGRGISGLSGLEARSCR